MRPTTEVSRTSPPHGPTRSRQRSPTLPQPIPPARPAPTRRGLPLSRRRKPRSQTREFPMVKLRCPICQREMEGDRSDWPQFPFCSPRCKTIDLGRWLGYRYGFPTEREDSEGGETAEEREPR